MSPRRPPRNRILLVEDELAQLLQEAISFAYCNYLIETATNGKEAIECAELYQESLALVVMDLRLPGIPGIEAIRRIRAFAPNVPILAFTAYGEALRNEAMMAGATEFSIKGHGGQFIADLMKTVDRMLKLTNMRQKADSK